MNKKTILFSCASLIFIVIISVLQFVFDFSNSWYLYAVLIIIASVIPFFAYFEGRKIKTSELVSLSVMIAVSVVSRLVFAFVPQAKPMASFVAVTGIAFGANAGFVCGAVSIFASNFFFGQGMFTPFQMLAMGLVGFFSGLIFHARPYSKKRVLVAGVTALLVLVIYGLIVDTCSVLMMATEYNLKSIFAIYASGFPFNIIHSVTTFVIMLLISNPMNNKFERLRIKYGVFDNEKN